MNLSCTICNNSKHEHYCLGKDRVHGIPGKFELIQCTRCKLIEIHPKPSMESLKKYYPIKGYYTYDDEQKTNNLREILNNYCESKIDRYCPHKENGIILDIGCGNGNFLGKMKKKGMQTFGIDAFQNSSNRDIDCFYHKELHECNLPQDYFDIITMNHVLEHLINPQEVLEEIHRILKPNGTFVVGVPNSNSLASKIFKSDWVQLDPPRHIYSFSDTNLLQLLENTGFTHQKTRYFASDFQFLGSVEYLLNRLRVKKVLLKDSNIINNGYMRVPLLPIMHLINHLKLGDSVEMHITKKESHLE